MNDPTISQAKPGGPDQSAASLGVPEAGRRGTPEGPSDHPVQGETLLADEDQWQEKAKKLRRVGLKLFLVQSLFGLAFPFGFWYFGGSAALERALSPAVFPPWAVVLFFVASYQAVVSGLFLPFSYYGGYHTQHRFGLSTQNRRGWFADWSKSALIGGFFFLAGMEAYYLLIEALPTQWWWLLALGLSIVALLLTFAGPVVLLPLFFKASPVADVELAHRIEALAERVGARVSKVRTIDMSRRTAAANAMLTGMGRTRQVLLGDTMLKQFSPDEVETVVAHELGHHVHGDIWKGLGLEVAGAWIGLGLLQFAVGPAFEILGMGSISELRNLPLLIVLGGVASLVIMPAANGVSRHYEAEADEFAARESRMPEAYRSALYRLARQNLAELWPPRWAELLLYTHPAIGRRMERVMGDRRAH